MKHASNLLRGAAALGLALAAGNASAHTGHGTGSLFQGLAHPLGLDHLLAMVAVGVWSAAAFDGARRWIAPLTFLAAMTAAALVAMAGLALPFVEHGIALSVAMFGAMLAFAKRVPAAPGLALVASAAALHGVAHGAELPAGASVAGYALGFLATTAALHAAGVGLGVALRERGAWIWRSAGALLGVAGVVLLAQA
ncbi:HupE/UreJ family protein [Azohydromonas sediminis]|uniref:HupE/UreJ family protein n=1 Tax=Azohydromonas sediminis TaxID=2259674 RepID=UPI000E647E4B|nr:HupE/UreJ family protein [Azohydromonas sediminis]